MTWFRPEVVAAKLSWKPNYNPTALARVAVQQHPFTHGAVVGMAFNDAYVVSEKDVRAAYLNGVWYTKKHRSSIIAGEMHIRHGIQFVQIETDEELLAIASGSLVYTVYKLGVRL